VIELGTPTVGMSRAGKAIQVKNACSSARVPRRRSGVRDADSRWITQKHSRRCFDRCLRQKKLEQRMYAKVAAMAAAMPGR
jgi:hypothetical protein